MSWRASARHSRICGGLLAGLRIGWLAGRSTDWLASRLVAAGLWVWHARPRRRCA